MLVRFVLCINVVAMLLAPAEPAPNDADVFEPVPIHVPPAAPDEASAGVKISGVVWSWGGDGAPVVGARVVIDCACLGQTRAQLTDEYGYFEFADLPAGTFTVTLHGPRGKKTHVFNMHANYILLREFTIDLESELHVWVPPAEERPVPAWETEQSTSERERCDRECRKAKRAQRRSERASGERLRGRAKRSCPPVRGRRE